MGDSTAPAKTPSRRAPRKPDLPTKLRVATLRLSRRLRNESVSACTESQYGVLAALLHAGPLSPGELADRERVQRPSMTRTIAAMEGLGLVTRSEHPTDGRQVVITVTEAGRDVVKETKVRRNAWLNKGLARLTAEERETVARAADILHRMAEE